MTTDELEDDKGNEPGLRDFLAAIKRRRVPLLLALAAGIIATVLLANLLPPRYESAATILIEQQELPVDLVRSTVTSYADQRVQMISQRVLTTQTMLGIINRYNLYPEKRGRVSREALIEGMRSDIALRMVSADVIDPRSGMPRSATIAFQLSYSSSVPAQASRVASELTTLFLNENVTNRTQLAQDATKFLGGEAERLSRRIVELEGALREFKEKHQDTLPELQPFTLQLLDRAEQEVRQLESRKSSLDQQRVYLEAQLAQLKPNDVLTGDNGQRILSAADRLKTLKAQLPSMKAVYAPTHPDIVRMEREIAGLEAEVGSNAASSLGNELARKLEQTRGALAQARERYAPGHPDVERLTREVAALETEIAQLPPAKTVSRETVTPDNPAYIQIEAQLAATRSDVEAVDAQIATLRGRISSFQRRITLSPQVESEYRALMRDFENSNAKYQEIRAKQIEASVAQSLEVDRKGERFTLIEPPLMPEEPVSPNRPLVMILGFALSLGLAAGLVAILEKLDNTVRGRKDVMQVLLAPPLALIPRIRTELDMAASRMRRLLAAGATAGALVAAVVAVHLLYRPLDVLWFSVMRRFGL